MSHIVLAKKESASEGEGDGENLMSDGKTWEMQETICQVWRHHQELALISDFLFFTKREQQLRYWKIWASEFRGYWAGEVQWHIKKPEPEASQKEI